MSTKASYLVNLADNLDQNIFNSYFERPYLIRSISTNPDVRKENSKIILECLKAMNFNGNFEVLQNFDIIIKCNYNVINKMQKVFGSKIDFLPIEFLDDKIKH